MKKISIVFVLFSFLFAACHTTRYPTESNLDYYEYDTAASVYSEEDYAEPEYQSSFTIINDLVHTKLDVRFDWEKQYCYGKAWITLRPHFYSTDSVTLDAKGFDIHSIEMVLPSGNIQLKYEYDSLQLHIELGRTYTNGEPYTLYIDYTAKPNELNVAGSAAITDARGLYFINPEGKEDGKPRQLWTQGETESNSCWFPTIDKPNMKTTLEISMTVEKEFVTLSNGLMIASKENADGTHTDTWKLDKPFAPYLVMMAAGPFAVVKDSWRNMEVNYYVDSAYATYAKRIFGNTPEMIEFFSKKLGVDYPWPKYSQVVVHDFVSGAMENVSATVHFEGLQQTPREMIDGDLEDYISHELFHQWFGDLVTTESWSNITLNEGFATYAEYLWNEYKYGKEEADYRINNDLNAYINQSYSSNAPLIRYHYQNREEVFDAISYQKGGRILHMLRNLVGDEAFFNSLNLYLNTNKYGAVEVNDLRLAFEKITGMDLQWFFNQWFLSAGHPVLEISYYYDEELNEQQVNIYQSASGYDEGVPEIFRLPMAVDIYNEGTVTRYSIVVDDAEESFRFPCNSSPDLVNVDADKVLVCEKYDYKSDTAYLFQLRYAPLFKDRLEALQYFASDTYSSLYRQAMLGGLKDKHWAIREEAVYDTYLMDENVDEDGKLRNQIIELASNDPESNVRSAAIEQFESWDDPSMISLLQVAIRTDSSYQVITKSIETLFSLDSIAAFNAVEPLEDEKAPALVESVAGVYSRIGDAAKLDYFISQIKNASGYNKYTLLFLLMQFIEQSSIGNPSVIEQGLIPVFNHLSTEEEWYLRFIILSRLNELQDRLNVRKQYWINQTGKRNAPADLTARIEILNLQIGLLENKIEHFKETESNENLKMLLEEK